MMATVVQYSFASLEYSTSRSMETPTSVPPPGRFSSHYLHSCSCCSDRCAGLSRVACTRTATSDGGVSNLPSRKKPGSYQVAEDGHDEIQAEEA